MVSTKEEILSLSLSHTKEQILSLSTYAREIKTLIEDIFEMRESLFIIYPIGLSIAFSNQASLQPMRLPSRLNFTKYTHLHPARSVCQEEEE